MTHLPNPPSPAPANVGAVPVVLSELLDSKGVCKILKLSARKLWSETEAGHIRSVRLGRLVRYDPSDVAAYIEFKKVGGYHMKGRNSAAAASPPSDEGGART
jgi:excisionase family DNA binding protein